MSSRGLMCIILYLRKLGNTNSNAENCTVHRETICDLDCSLRFTVVESNMNLTDQTIMRTCYKPAKTLPNAQ